MKQPPAQPKPAVGQPTRQAAEPAAVVPVADNGTDEGRSKNRRTDFEVIR